MGTRVGRPQRVFQLAIGQQPGIGGDRGTAKLQQQMAVEIEPQNAPIRFTRPVPHRHSISISRKLLNVNLEPPSMRSKSRPHPGNAGLGLDHMPAGDKLALAMIPEIDIWRAASWCSSATARK